ncbi:hypothetical protein PROFUN_09219 [Planoprotostelium fungivorum]|uniref:Uncharacterized protein n=1 Tax=Planoprotostelium fungivorum TaxID=1890364 RepID=A0A2P6NHK2_9EUKA|nr:hypothetical protein PROFUN_15458 [Planoprotostelium fungivorum]PRP83446.1 hypothetical protein PROFUN_09219 [Planoprotostelium fungivorum]
MSSTSKDGSLTIVRDVAGDDGTSSPAGPKEEASSDRDRKRNRAKTCVVHGCSHDTARAERSEFGSKVRCGTTKTNDLRPHQVLCPVYQKYGTGTMDLQRTKQGLLLKMDELLELFNLSDGEWDRFMEVLSSLQTFWTASAENSRKKLRWKVALQHLQEVNLLSEIKATAAANYKPPFTLNAPDVAECDSPQGESPQKKQKLDRPPVEDVPMDNPPEAFRIACQRLAAWAKNRNHQERVQDVVNRLINTITGVDGEDSKKIQDGREGLAPADVQSLPSQLERDTIQKVPHRPKEERHH